MKSISSVGVAVGLFDIVGDHVGSDLARFAELRSDNECWDDELGSIEGLEEEDGIAEGTVDNDGFIDGNNAWLLKNEDTLDGRTPFKLFWSSVQSVFE